MEKARIHLVQLATCHTLGKLEMKLSTALNIALREECPSLSSEDWRLLLRETAEYLDSSSETYNKHNIR